MSALTTLRGILTETKFISEDGTEISYVPYKNFKYDFGNVFALFEICGGTYILWQTIPINE